MTIRVLESLGEIAPSQWNALLPPERCPLMEHGYLAALEQSGSLARASLQPRHVTLWDGERLVAAAPCYLKHGERADPLPDWAYRVASKHELPYFPTLFVGIPFASVGGPKLLTAPDVDRVASIERLVAGAKELIGTAPSPAIHVYLATREEIALLERAGFHPRISPQYAWINEGYASFDEFLARLKSKRRSGIREERRRVTAADVRMRTLRGADLDPRTMELMWQLHSTTIAKHGAEFDLYTRELFLLLGELLQDRVEIYLAERGGEPLAASLYLASPVGLYSRTCGSFDEAPYVHFEVTWYHAIEEAIARKLTFVDPGGPGAHKLTRGFSPIGFHHSATWIGDEALSEAAGRLIEKERLWMPQHLEQQRRQSALRAADQPP